MNIGIIGGGQLGMMMAREAIKLGHKIISLDPSKSCSITKYASIHLVYNYYDEEGIKKLIASSDVITYEFENINKEVITSLTDKLPQKIQALEISQNRLKEKELAKSLGIQTAKFKKYIDKTDLFYPSIIKSIMGGYDGKGQLLIKDKLDFKPELLNVGTNYIIEEIIDFDYEISVISTRDSFGKIVYYPVPKNVHKNGILFTSIITKDVPLNVIDRAKAYTMKILESLDYIGTLAVEFFVRGTDVLFNEFAPRPHNSGHYTIEGCNVSQFKNHILAITSNHVIEPLLLADSIMINVLGQNLGYFDKARQLSNVYIHDYYKQEAFVNRKMGHITIIGTSKEDCIRKMDLIIGEQK
ncbi:MAG: 5-(carboxyamino)imidazole ribonucleotide synthase [Candidatus Izemoplasmatales bacterium]|jgi:5-(carboxyamino)imidazole ribonucleotide synthase|nr:5-(carboxyamino)imidazole ribonucleotide synthase [Candidatus Izemoplasmatales bacterium]